MTKAVKVNEGEGVYKAKYMCCNCGKSPVLQAMQTRAIAVAQQLIEWYQKGTLENNSGLRNAFIHKCRDGSLGDARFVGFEYVEKTQPVLKTKEKGKDDNPLGEDGRIKE